MGSISSQGVVKAELPTNLRILSTILSTSTFAHKSQFSASLGKSRQISACFRSPGSPILLPSFFAHWRAASGLAGGVARIFMLNEICARISLHKTMRALAGG